MSRTSQSYSGSNKNSLNARLRRQRTFEIPEITTYLKNTSDDQYFIAVYTQMGIYDFNWPPIVKVISVVLTII